MYNKKSLILMSLLALLTAVTSAFSMPATLSEKLSEAEQEVDKRLEILKKLTNYKPDRPFYSKNT